MSRFTVARRNIQAQSNESWGICKSVDAARTYIKPTATSSTLSRSAKSEKPSKKCLILEDAATPTRSPVRSNASVLSSRRGMVELENGMRCLVIRGLNSVNLPTCARYCTSNNELSLGSELDTTIMMQ
jgi:hypothetical protein